MVIQIPVSEIEMPSNFEEYAIPIMNILKDKLVLTGSLSLKLLGVPFARKELKSSDFDFGLRAPLTIDEFVHFKDFFELQSNFEDQEKYNAEDEKREPRPYTPEIELINKLITLKKVKFNSDNGIDLIYKMDIFNYDYILPKDIIEIEYKGYIIPVIHPGITISYKAKYAFRNHQTKHYDDFKHLIENFQQYNNIIIKLWENQAYKRTIVDEGVISFKERMDDVILPF
jgi:hypothetical protein